jgi:hypothetical protein
MWSARKGGFRCIVDEDEVQPGRVYIPQPPDHRFKVGNGSLDTIQFGTREKALSLRPFSGFGHPSRQTPKPSTSTVPSSVVQGRHRSYLFIICGLPKRLRCAFSVSGVVSGVLGLFVRLDGTHNRWMKFTPPTLFQCFSRFGC